MFTKNDAGTFDYFARAGDSEPLFVLLGRDRHAPALVWLWAVLRELDGEDEATVKNARECCEAMLHYAVDRGRPAVGVGQSVLAGVLELIRTANMARDLAFPNNAARNEPTGVDFLRVLFNHTRVETSTKAIK